MTSGGSEFNSNGVRARRKSDRATGVNPPKLRVLAVDDDAAYLRYLHLVLTRAGFDVTTVADGSAAVSRVRDDKSIDLMVVDLAMPVMDGIETVKLLQEEIRA